MTPEMQKQIDRDAFAAARLQFHPEYSADAFTACEICYKQGAKASAEKIEQLEAEVARLTGLLEKEAKEWATIQRQNMTDGYISESDPRVIKSASDYWENFKRQNNLQ